MGQYAAGIGLGLVCVGPVVLGARRLRRCVVPGWRGTAGVLADAIISLGLLVIALEITGIVGALTRVGVALACVGTGALAGLVAGRIGPGTGRDRAPASKRPSRLASAVALGALAAVSAPWIGWTIYSYRHGMEGIDTLWYHLPQAARFVQTGSILHLQYFDRDPVTVFYPANAELFHALGLVLFRTDLLSPAINLGWAALALLAAWELGAPTGAGAGCLVAALVLLGTPAIVDTQPGGAYNDIACVALLLAAAAVLRRGGIARETSFLAAIAAGIALGTKFTMIVPVVALGAGVLVVAGRGDRARQAAIWAGSLLALGGYWYLRNAITAGNPVPSVSLHLGPLVLHAPRLSTPMTTVGQYLTDGRVWRVYFLPGLRQSLGPAWWAILALAAGGAASALMSRGDRVRQMVGAVAVLSAAAFVITPQFLGAPGEPGFFAYNVRYAAVPVSLGLTLLASHPALRDPRHALAVLAALALTLIGTELDPGVWPSGLSGVPFAPPLHGAPALGGALIAVLLVVLGLLWILRPRRPAARWLRPAGTVAVVLAVAGGWPIAESYGDGRYANTPPSPTIYRWAQQLRHARIGVVGLILQYPLYGPDSSNFVQYLGQPAPHGGFEPITSCQGWREAVDRGHYGWLLIAPINFPLARSAAPELAWTESSRSAVAVLRQAPGAGDRDAAIVFRLSGALDPRACPR